MEKPGMRKRKNITFILFFPLILITVGFIWRWQNVPPGKPDSIPPGDYTYTVDYSKFRIQQLIDRYHLPGVAVALIDDQNTIWQDAFGLANIEEEIPARVDTVYKFWSVTKVFTAMETMRLVEEGLVDLDAPITDYLPNFTIQSRFPDSEPITIRSILSHQAGLPRNECHSIPFRPEDPTVLGEMVKSLEDCHMAFPVGTRFKYSNVGPATLGYIIQTTRGESFPNYMKEQLLSPIGMKNSAFLLKDLPPQKEVAPGYEYYKGEYYPYDQGDINSLPSGNLYSTVEDMGEFVKFVLRGGESNGVQIIHPGTLALMFKDQFPNQSDPQPMGLGWKTGPVFGSELLVWHDGGPDDGTGSLVALLPERKLGIVVIANSTSFGGNVSVSLATEILELMLETKYQVIPPKIEKPAPMDVDPSLLEGYVGKYIAFGEVLEVSMHGDKLKGSIQGMKFDLVPIDKTHFQISHWLLKLGLADFLPLPIDLQALELEFLMDNRENKPLLIINIGGIIYETCPRYPEITTFPPGWEKLLGGYDLVSRLPSGKIGDEMIGKDEIQVEDGVLKMPGVIGPLNPISKTELIILSGPFAGETMIYDPETGYLYHQWVIYKPTNQALLSLKVSKF